jgi:hypothetical protein
MNPGTVIRLTIGYGLWCASEGLLFFEVFGESLGVVEAWGSEGTYWVRWPKATVSQFGGEDIEPIANGRRCRRGRGD